MDASIVKAMTDLVAPFVGEGAKKVFHRNEIGPHLLTDALLKKLSKLIEEASYKQIVENLEKRNRYVSLRRQINFESCMQLALDLARIIPEEDRRPADEDWFSMWFSAVENVSDELMQTLWAKAFAQKINMKEREVSLRAIDSLRLMQSRDVVNFKKFKDVCDVLGYVFINSNRVMHDLFYPHSLDELLDLSLITKEETFLKNIAFPGGYALYFSLPPDLLAPDPFRVLSLSARGKELSNTMPKEIAEIEPTNYGFSLKDPIFVAKYINMVAAGFDRRYDIVLSVHGEAGKRPPSSGRKRTHQWDYLDQRWIRKEDLPQNINTDIVKALEDGIFNE